MTIPATPAGDSGGFPGGGGAGGGGGGAAGGGGGGGQSSGPGTKEAIKNCIEGGNSRAACELILQ